ncbi:hypothetical protein AWB92_07510 [Mycobacterium sp. IEC1808]|uniref:DUF5995 family protein n=1 Tax=Mycobacterium sp. IEC1808 TaxID=1743230 RepID=UPI000A149159|nr:DUF5995 family protein [Mycobacterium sp. IEC1808]ORW96200.1 hypothetical protein AWB92_07510 [Mycobacterium sp. IEC1808]
MSPTSVADVVARMRAIAAQLPPDDGAEVFNGVYLRVTEMMADRLATKGVFHDEAFVTDLDVRFAGYWFDAYDAAGAKPKAWAPLFAARGSKGILPIQFALAGMNAHIEHDLPLAVIATCAARRCTPDSEGVHADYEKINDVLASVEAEIRRSFLDDVERSIDDHLEPVAHLITSWDIAKARDFAWLTMQTMWELRRVRGLFDAYAAGLARTVGMGSRLLLTPLT